MLKEEYTGYNKIQYTIVDVVYDKRRLRAFPANIHKLSPFLVFLYPALSVGTEINISLIWL